MKDAEALCADLISGHQSKDEIKAILMHLRAKGETAEEIAGFSKAIVSQAQKIPFAGTTIDLCGTGGSALERFNVSTSVAFIVACFDVKLAKHGNKGSRQPNGSFDLLEHLGIAIDLNGEQLAECLEKHNLAFVYARNAHPAMKHVAEARKEVQGRTIFNLAGPLSNPTQVQSQVIGTADPKIQMTLLEAAKLLGRQNVAVVYGEPGVDEVSISGVSTIVHYAAGVSTRFEWSPQDIGLAYAEYADLPVGLAENNAKVFYRLLDNEALSGINDMVCINAGFSLFSAGISPTIQDGYKEAKRVIKSGLMKKKFEDYRNFSQRIAV